MLIAVAGSDGDRGNVGVWCLVLEVLSHCYRGLMIQSVLWLCLCGWKEKDFLRYNRY